MERLTFEGNFCDISMCVATPDICGGTCSQRKVWERLKEYEDREEQGRLITLPCEMYDRIYMIVTKRPKINMPEFTFIKVTQLMPSNLFRVLEDFGKTVFLTREAAEQALGGAEG